MQAFSESAHKDALVRRRIKLVVGHPSMARLFKGGTSFILQEQLFPRLQPSDVTKIRSRDEYDNWLIGLVEDNCWEQCSRKGLSEDRWAYFAKLINIVTYEIVSNRELVSESDWQRVLPWLHLPLDSNVFYSLQEIDPEFPATWVLIGMTREQYWAMQNAARKLAEHYAIPPIRFEDAWAS